MLAKKKQHHRVDFFLLNCPDYEKYLETFVTKDELHYLRDMKCCKELVKLGYRSNATVLSPKMFQLQKQIVHEQIFPTKLTKAFFSAHLVTMDPVLLELAAREMPNHQKIISTIIFMTHRNKNGFEVSGFIDFDESLSYSNLKVPGCYDWFGIFQEKVKLRPMLSNLSYYDIYKGLIGHNNSENYIVLHDVKNGLSFIHRGDHKILCVDNFQSSSKGSFLRSVVRSSKYGYVILYDHIIRKKI